MAVHLARQIGEFGPFELVSQGKDLPVFAWKLRKPRPPIGSLYDLADRLRDRGWQVPAYRLPANRQDLVVQRQRVVVRNGFTCDLADMLLADIDTGIAELSRSPRERKATHRTPFSHT